MKQIKRILIFSLCIAIILSCNLFAFAAQENGKNVVASVFFASDYQFYKQYTPGLFGQEITSCKPVIEKLSTTVKKAGHNIETVVIGGDYTQNDSMRDPQDPTDASIFGSQVQYHYGNSTSNSMAEIRQAFNMNFNDVNFLFAQGNHDPDAAFCSEITKSGAYEFPNYIVYILNDEDYVGPRPRVNYDNEFSQNRIVPGSITKITDAKSKTAMTASGLCSYLQALIDKKDCRPVFVCSHQPIHFTSSNYNGNGYLIFNAINEAAKKLDIVYFFAHTHVDVDDIGGGLSYVKKGNSLKIANDTLGDNSYSAEKINFTYLNYGFLAYYNGTNAVISSSVTDITPNTIEIKRYGAKTGSILQAYSIKRVNPLVKKAVKIKLLNAEIKENEKAELKFDESEIKGGGLDELLKTAEFVLTDKNKKKFTLDEASKSSGEYNIEIKNIDELNKSIASNSKLSAYNITIEDNATLTVKKEEPKNIIFTIGSKNVNIFGENFENDVEPIIREDRTMLPARLLAEKLGAKVSWDSSERKVTIKNDEIEIVMIIDNNIALINNKEVKLESPAFIENSRTYTPLRFIAESLGAKVNWNSELKQVIITAK